MPNNIKHRALQIVHRGIDRLWVDPLESQIIPRLESGKQTRFRSVFLRRSSWFADVGRIAVMDLRVNVMRWAGPEWTVTYIGDGESTEVLSNILFPEPPKVDELPRVYLWQVPALIQKYSGNGDLVVCELNKILRWALNGVKISFAVPRWIRQVLEEIDRPMENILASMSSNMRRNIRRLEKKGFSYSFTQEKEDFDFFYYRMYLPYLTSRHKGQGMILDDYEDVHNEFVKGELMLIKDGQDPICGGVSYMDGDLYVGQIMGILDGEIDLVKRGVILALYWYSLHWAHDQGARRFDFGGSRALMSNGVFIFKQRWGTRVYLHKSMHTLWSFYAQVLPHKLHRHLNELGLITSLDGKCYRLILDGPPEYSSSIDMQREIILADKCGLEGLALISNKGAVRTISSSN